MMKMPLIIYINGLQRFRLRGVFNGLQHYFGHLKDKVIQRTGIDQGKGHAKYIVHPKEQNSVNLAPCYITTP